MTNVWVDSRVYGSQVFAYMEKKKISRGTLAAKIGLKPHEFHCWMRCGTGVSSVAPIASVTKLLDAVRHGRGAP